MMKELASDVALLTETVRSLVAERRGAKALALVESLEADAKSLRAGALAGGRDAFAKTMQSLDDDEIAAVAHAFTQMLHFMNVAEEQHRIRVLRMRDRSGRPVAGSIAAACRELAASGAPADDVRALVARLFVMPVLTAHPTEARRRTVLDHLADASAALDALDDPRLGASDRARLRAELRESATALFCTDESREKRPTPYDEVRAGMHVFERTLFDVTPAVVREVEEQLAAAYPGQSFAVPAFLRWGTWIGGDRDGNPNVTADVTRSALERYRSAAIARAIRDVESLGRVLSISARKVDGDGLKPLYDSIARDRTRLAFAPSRVAENEPWRNKLDQMRARLEATRVRADAGYASALEYEEDLALIAESLDAVGLRTLARGRVRDALLRARAFGFHLATLDLRQHSAVHEAAVSELLARGGVPNYAEKDEAQRVQLLAGLLERAQLASARDRAGLSAATREILATLDVVGRARRDQGHAACERYVVSFTSAPSDLLEVLFLARAASLAPDELRPVPLLEQLEDLARAAPMATAMMDLAPIRYALRGELEVMIGYSDSSKQAGYVASQVALRRAQEELARVADERGAMLTVFHGRGGAVGRGGGPANRAIRAQPPEALRGRLRVTEQGETITARYGRPQIARRDLELMVNAVLLGSMSRGSSRPAGPDAEALLDRVSGASRAAYESLIADRGRLARYTVAATPIHEISELPIASRPASRKPGLVLEDLRAIPWVFSWTQSRHGVPGWFGLGAALDAAIAEVGLERVRALYADWPFFRALVDNAQLALARADISVAEQYARLAEAESPDLRGVFDAIRAEHARTCARVLEVTNERRLLADQPTIAETVERRNPYVDVLSHAQIELLRRFRSARDVETRAELRAPLFATINGIAAGLMTAG